MRGSNSHKKLLRTTRTSPGVLVRGVELFVRVGTALPYLCKAPGQHAASLIKTRTTLKEA